MFFRNIENCGHASQRSDFESLEWKISIRSDMQFFEL